MLAMFICFNRDWWLQSVDGETREAVKALRVDRSEANIVASSSVDQP